MNENETFREPSIAQCDITRFNIVFCLLTCKRIFLTKRTD